MLGAVIAARGRTTHAAAGAPCAGRAASGMRGRGRTTRGTARVRSRQCWRRFQEVRHLGAWPVLHTTLATVLDAKGKGRGVAPLGTLVQSCKVCTAARDAWRLALALIMACQLGVAPDQIP